MTEFTPSEARVAIDYCNARTTRDPSVTMHEADAEFDRMIDLVKREAIWEFVSYQSAEYRKHSGNAVEEDIALAVGRFGVPLESFYGDDVSISQLSDYLIAEIQRQKERLNEHE